MTSPLDTPLDQAYDYDARDAMIAKLKAEVIRLRSLVAPEQTNSPPAASETPEQPNGNGIPSTS